MPGMGRTKYWWAKYEKAREQGNGKEAAARIASLIEDRHKAKLKRKRK